MILKKLSIRNNKVYVDGLDDNKAPLENVEIEKYSLAYQRGKMEALDKLISIEHINGDTYFLAGDEKSILAYSEAFSLSRENKEIVNLDNEIKENKTDELVDKRASLTVDYIKKEREILENKNMKYDYYKEVTNSINTYINNFVIDSKYYSNYNDFTFLKDRLYSDMFETIPLYRDEEAKKYLVNNYELIDKVKRNSGVSSEELQNNSLLDNAIRCYVFNEVFDDCLEVRKEEILNEREDKKMIYDYHNAVKEDVNEFIDENFIGTDYYKECNSLEALKDKLYDDMFIDDSVTGNGSGSYTFNTQEAQENLVGNLELIQTVNDEYELSKEQLLDPEQLDSSIRCYLLDQTLNEVMDEREEELQEELDRQQEESEEDSI